MNNNFWFIIIVLFFLSCREEPEKNDNWIDSILLSEENIVMATSFDINSLLKKSDLANSDQLSSQKKLLINAFNSSFKSSLLGFNVDIPQKLFIVANKDNLNGALFWVGELTSEFLFKQTLKNFFDVDDFSDSDINTFYIKEYNLYISFNEYNFIVGFSPEKKYVKSKLNAYFNNESILKSNLAISKFLENTDDIGFYFSNKRINQLTNNTNNSLFSSQLSNLSRIDQFGNEIYVSLNFLKNKLSVNTFSYDNNQLFYKNIGVKSDFKNFINLDEKMLSFGFLNLNLNQEEHLFSDVSLTDFNEDLLFFKILQDQKLFSTLNGEISFLISDSLNNQNASDTATSKEDFWENDFNEFEIDFKFEIPPSLISFGIKDLTDLTDQLKKINNQFVENKSILINDSYVLISNNILHISNKKELLSVIDNSIQFNASPIINSQFFQNPLYAEIDLQLILNYLQLNNLNQFSNKQTNLFNKVTITGNNNSFSILIDIMSNDENSLKSITDLILQNQLLESYL